MKSWACAPLLLLVLAACGHGRDRAEGPRDASPANWRTIATAADRARLRNWRSNWTDALARATAAGHGGAITAQGVLLRPDAALEIPAPPPGDYRCRTIKVGAKAANLPHYTAYPAFGCRIAQEGDTLSLTKLDGSQRPVGLLLPDDASRMIFLGTLMLGDERRAQQYGRDAERDMIGAFERIGPRRWRLVLPSPQWESLLDVMELVPA